MRLSVVRRGRIRSKRGAALVEFVLIVPLLVLFFMGVFDLGRALNTYMKLAQIVGEGVRTAGSRAALEEGSNFRNLLAQNLGCDGVSTDAWDHCPGQYNLQSRIMNMISIYQLPIDSDRVEVISGYTKTSAFGTDGQTVSVTITAKYEGLLPLFDDLTLRARKTGPYLF